MAERFEVELETRLAKQDIFESPRSFVEQTSVADGGIYERFEENRVEYSDTDSDAPGDRIYFPEDGYDGDDLGNTSTLRNSEIAHEIEANVCGGAD